MPEALSSKPEPYRPTWIPSAKNERYSIGWTPRHIWNREGMRVDEMMAPSVRGAAPAQVVTSFVGLPSSVHRVLVQHYRIDDSHSNAYTVWKGRARHRILRPSSIRGWNARGNCSFSIRLTGLRPVAAR